MRLRSFHGTNISEAMRQVRDALGTDAIIVATREDEDGGVRITAAMDETGILKQDKPAAAPPPPQSASSHEVVFACSQRAQASVQ
jgi:flagellar biosynthesis protein FlhF